MATLTDEQKAAEEASWREWQTAWGNTESGAHAHGWANGYKAGEDASRADVNRLLRDGEATVDLIMQDVMDLEYDTCDEAQPDLLHVTRDELWIILRRHILGED